jgi:ABC-type phosphate/phosphonate transport system ATPase subunit
MTKDNSAVMAEENHVLPKKIKVTAVGDSGVGKTCLLMTYQKCVQHTHLLIIKQLNVRYMGINNNFFFFFKTWPLVPKNFKICNRTVFFPNIHNQIRK